MPTRKPPKPAALSTEAKRMGIRLLQVRVLELENLDIDSISSGDDPRVQDLEAHILSTLSQIYGEDSLQFARLQLAANLDLTPYSVNLAGRSYRPPVSEIQDGLRKGRARALSLLRGEGGGLA